MGAPATKTALQHTTAGPAMRHPPSLTMSSRRLAHVATHVSCAAAAGAEDTIAEDTREEHIMIPTRDGVRLSCSLCRPAAAGTCPVLLTLHYAGTHPAAGSNADLARQGFAVADVVFRGCHQSEGMADGGVSPCRDCHFAATPIPPLYIYQVFR